MKKIIIALLCLTFFGLFAGLARATGMMIDSSMSAMSREMVIKGVNECVGIALKKYRGARVAYEQLRLAETKVTEAKRNKYPTAALRWTESGGNISEQDYEGRKMGVEVQQPLFHFGRVRYSVAQAEVNLDIARYNYYRITRDVIYRVRESYYTVARLTMNLELQGNLLREAERISALAKKEHDMDLIPRVEFEEVQSQYRQLMFQVDAAWKELRQARLVLAQLLKLDTAQEVHTMPLSEQWFLQDAEQTSIHDVNEYFELALRKRPDVAVSRLLVKFGDFGWRLARSQEMPKVDVVGSLFKSGEAFVNDSLDLDEEWFVGLQVNVPLGKNSFEYNYSRDEVARRVGEFRGTQTFSHDMAFRLYNNLGSPKHEAMIAREQAEIDTMELEELIQAEVNQAYTDLQQARTQFELANSRVTFRERELRVLEERLKMNQAFLSDLLNAKITVYGEYAARVQALTNYYLARAGLEKAVGAVDEAYIPSAAEIGWE